MRALRDLIAFCELTFGADHGGDAFTQALLDRAREALTALRKLAGDNRPAEDIAFAAMIEPRDLRTALQLCAGALRSMERLSLVDPQRPITFVGDWSHFGTKTIPQILDQANEALEIV